MDNLNYFYDNYSNRLKRVADEISTPLYPLDLENQTSNTNYTYYNDGNLKTDASEGITQNGPIKWNIYNKMTEFSKSGYYFAFNYDASGNRIFKSAANVFTYYIYDAKGNVLATYSATGPEHATVSFDQFFLYGSSRFGMYNVGSSFSSPPTYTRTRGKRNYELSNHLANVLAVVSDRKLPKATNIKPGSTDYFDADVLNAQDYYPFGQIMPGRYGRVLISGGLSSFVVGQSGNYRYGFNGKENDNEIKGFGNEQDYGMRVYDPRVGRFLSVDPLANSFASFSPYQFAANNPIYYVDKKGQYQYPAEFEAQYRKDYPILTNFLENGGIQDYLKNDNIRQALNIIGGFTDKQIDDYLSNWRGKSFEIEIKQLCENCIDERNGYTPASQNGLFQLDIDLVNQLEHSSEAERPAALLAVISTVIHESTHPEKHMIKDGDSYKSNKSGDFERKIDPKTAISTFYYKDKIIGTEGEKGKAIENALYHNGNNDSRENSYKQGIEGIKDQKKLIDNLRNSGQENVIPKIK